MKVESGSCRMGVYRRARWASRTWFAAPDQSRRPMPTDDLGASAAGTVTVAPMAGGAGTTFSSSTIDERGSRLEDPVPGPTPRGLEDERPRSQPPRFRNSRGCSRLAPCFTTARRGGCFQARVSGPCRERLARRFGNMISRTGLSGPHGAVPACSHAASVPLARLPPGSGARYLRPFRFRGWAGARGSGCLDLVCWSFT